MTIEQMAKALSSVGACFAISTAKFLSPGDPPGEKPSYHIHPDAAHPHEEKIVRVYSQEQLLDWVRTQKAILRARSPEEAEMLRISYEDRWMSKR